MANTQNFKLFETIQTNMINLGFIPNQEHPFNTQHLRGFVIGLCANILQLVYFVLEANTTKQYMDSVFTITVGIAILISFVSTVLKTENIFILISGLEEIINTRLEYPTSKMIYNKTNRLVEKLCKFAYFTIVKVSLPCVVLPKVFISFFLYITTDAGPNAFELPLPTWFPFEWHHPISYLIAVIWQFLMVLYPFRYLTCFASLGFGSFLAAVSLIKDITNDLEVFNEKATKSKQPRKKAEKHLNELLELISLHSQGKRIFTYFADLYDHSLTALFAAGTICICITMLMIDMELSLDEMDSLVMFESILYLIHVIVILFIACELGQRFTRTLDEVDDFLCQLNWYYLPIGFQRLLPTILINSQEPVVLRCFGCISCSRDQFKRVINKGYSGFMVFHKFYN